MVTKMTAETPIREMSRCTLTANTNLLDMRCLQLEKTSRTTRHTGIFPDQWSQFLREQGFPALPASSESGNPCINAADSPQVAFISGNDGAVCAFFKQTSLWSVRAPNYSEDDILMPARFGYLPGDSWMPGIRTENGPSAVYKKASVEGNYKNISHFSAG